MCTFTRKGDGHWILVGCSTIWVPELQQIIPTKRVAYAAFVGPILETEEVWSSCGVRQCIAPTPGHLALRPGRRSAKALYLPQELETLTKPESYSPADDVAVLPKGLTLRHIHVVRFMTKGKNTLAQIREATLLPTVEIVKIQNGVYDGAVKNLGSHNMLDGAMKQVRAAKRVGSVADIPDSRPPLVVGVPQDRNSVGAELEGVDVSEEEKMWLKQMGIG